MRILGVDPSLTATGLCRVDQEGQLDGMPVGLNIQVCTLATFKPKLKTKREYSRRVAHVIDQIEGALEGVDMVAMEDLAYGAKGEAVWVLPWLSGRVIDLCEARDIPLLMVGTSQVKKYATGKGNCSKETALLATVARFPGVVITNNNEADALIVAAIGCRYRGLPIDAMPKAHWVDVMANLAA